MNRESVVLFFYNTYISCITEAINDIIAKNREMNIVVENIGILKDTLAIAGNDDDIQLLSGNIFIILSSNISNKQDIMGILHMDRDIVTSVTEILVIDNTIDDIFNTENNHIFIRKLKTKKITTAHIAEIDMNIIGLLQDTGHNNLHRLDIINPLYLMSDGFIVYVDIFETFEDRPCNVMPGLTVSHDSFEVSLRIPPTKTEQTCLACYILSNFEDWKNRLSIMNETCKKLKEHIKAEFDNLIDKITEDESCSNTDKKELEAIVKSMLGIE